MSETPSTIAIRLDRVELRVHVGEHPWEKYEQHPTRLRVDLELVFPYRAYWNEHNGFVDYDPLRAFLKALEDKPHVNKLETLARAILKACFTLTPAARVKLALSKPDIFPEMEGVGIAIDVARTDFEA